MKLHTTQSRNFLNKEHIFYSMQSAKNYGAVRNLEIVLGKFNIVYRLILSSFLIYYCLIDLFENRLLEISITYAIVFVIADIVLVVN